MNKEDIYKEKNSDYYNHIRYELIQMIEGDNNKILDIGCGEGQTGWTLKKSGKAKDIQLAQKLYDESYALVKDYL